MAARAGRAAQRTNMPLQGQRILLVEDDPLTALQLQEALDSAGAEIAVATTLHEANELSGGNLAAAVLDVNLDGEMSQEVAERLIARKVPVVFATGYDAATILPEHLRAVPTLQKPIDTGALVQKLLELTAQR